MKQKISLFVFLLSYLFYSCNKDDDLNLANASKVTSAEDIKVMSKVELDNYLSDDYIYSFNSNIARTKSDGSRGANLVKELKDFLAANPKKATQLQKKYGNIAWAYANESSEEGVALLSTITSPTDTKIAYLLLITKSENGIKIVARDRKDALKAKSLKELNSKTEKNQIPKEYLISAFLSFEIIMFKYSDCELIKELEKLGNANSERKGDRDGQCTWEPNYLPTGYYSQGWTATYGYSNPVLNYTGLAISGYTFHCDGLDTGMETSCWGCADVVPSYGANGTPVTVPCQSWVDDVSGINCHKTDRKELFSLQFARPKTIWNLYTPLIYGNIVVNGDVVINSCYSTSGTHGYSYGENGQWVTGGTLTNQSEHEIVDRGGETKPKICTNDEKQKKPGDPQFLSVRFNGVFSFTSDSGSGGGITIANYGAEYQTGTNSASFYGTKVMYVSL